MGDPNLAVDALLNPSGKNHYDERGICTGGPGPYLPGNGGLLYAVAMMAAGWDGAPTRNAPGFPERRFVDRALGRLEAGALINISELRIIEW